MAVVDTALHHTNPSKRLWPGKGVEGPRLEACLLRSCWLWHRKRQGSRASKASELLRWKNGVMEGGREGGGYVIALITQYRLSGNYEMFVA